MSRKSQITPTQAARLKAQSDREFLATIGGWDKGKIRRAEHELRHKHGIKQSDPDFQQRLLEHLQQMDD